MKGLNVAKLVTLHPKVGGAGAAGAVTLIVLHVLAYYHVQLGSEVQAAIAVLASVAGGYLTPSPASEPAPVPVAPPAA